MDACVLSGVAPSGGGAGRLLDELMGYAAAKNRRVQFEHISARSGLVPAALKGTRAYRVALGLYQRVLARRFRSRAALRGRSVMVLHPQTIGWDMVFELLRNDNEVYLYVLDNSFFCVRAYNHLAGELAPCLRCLTHGWEMARQQGCTPNQSAMGREENLAKLAELRARSAQIVFLVQNENQGRLIERHFGAQARTVLVGMYTSEFDAEAIASRREGFDLDLVYHGGNVEAKGLRYALRLAEQLPTRRLLIPYPRGAVERILRLDTSRLGNVVFEPSTWETGLASAVADAKVVLCPSLWSAPIEGALIKSIIHNGCVAAYDAEYSFARELPGDALIQLTGDVAASAERIAGVLDDPETRAGLVDRSQAWVGGYIDARDEAQARLFDLIEPRATTA